MRKIRLQANDYAKLCYMRGVKPDFSPNADSLSSRRVRVTEEEYEALKEVKIEKEQNISDRVLEDAVLRKKAKDTEDLKRALVSKQEEIEQLSEILSIRNATSSVEIYDIKFAHIPSGKETVSISLLSDIHIEESVTPDSVLGLNEFNLEIAKRRLDNYFINLAKLISHHQRNYTIKKHIIGLLGDIIGGYIHDELMQTNATTPLGAISYAKSCLMSGFKYLQENLDVESIDVVCIVGNHGRTTKKMQYANLTTTSYEYYLYQDLAEMCKIMGFTKFNFIIPSASLAIIKIFNENYMFAHGNFGFSYKGGVGYIYMSLIRYFGKTAPLLKIKRLFIGHYHTTIDIPEAVVNGSVKGYDAFSMGHSFPFEEPKQALVLLNERRGFTNFQSIYLD